jgi:hypothetical protein
MQCLGDSHHGVVARHAADGTIVLFSQQLEWVKLWVCAAMGAVWWPVPDGDRGIPEPSS